MMIVVMMMLLVVPMAVAEEALDVLCRSPRL